MLVTVITFALAAVALVPHCTASPDPSPSWTQRPTRDWRSSSTWGYSTKAWDRGFSTRKWSYSTQVPTRTWDAVLHQGYKDGQLVRLSDGQLVQFGNRDGNSANGFFYTQSPIIHYQQGMMPTPPSKVTPACKSEQMERCYQECEERKIHSFTCRPQFGVAFTCSCSVSIYIPNVAV